jgi:hypothetical protein
VDATINDKLTFLDYETTDGPTGLKIAAETDEAGEQAFVFTKDKSASLMVNDIFLRSSYLILVKVVEVDIITML